MSHRSGASSAQQEGGEQENDDRDWFKNEEYSWLKEGFIED